MNRSGTGRPILTHPYELELVPFAAYYVHITSSDC